jgi:hypothetical protein
MKAASRWIRDRESRRQASWRQSKAYIGPAASPPDRRNRSAQCSCAAEAQAFASRRTSLSRLSGRPGDWQGFPGGQGIRDRTRPGRARQAGEIQATPDRTRASQRLPRQVETRPPGSIDAPLEMPGRYRYHAGTSTNSLAPRDCACYPANRIHHKHGQHRQGPPLESKSARQRSAADRNRRREVPAIHPLEQNTV